MMRERYSLRNSICRCPIIVRPPFLPAWSVLLGLADIGDDLVRSQRPVVVEIGDDLLHEGFGQPDGAVLVVQVIIEDRQRELLRALALVGPFEAVAGESLDLVVLVERPAVGRHHEPVDGAPALVGRHGLTPPGGKTAPGRRCRPRAPRLRSCRARRSGPRAAPPARPPRPARPPA